MGQGTALTTRLALLSAVAVAAQVRSYSVRTAPCMVRLGSWLLRRLPHFDRVLPGHRHTGVVLHSNTRRGGRPTRLRVRARVLVRVRVRVRLCVRVFVCAYVYVLSSMREAHCACLQTMCRTRVVARACVARHGGGVNCSRRSRFRPAERAQWQHDRFRAGDLGMHSAPLQSA